VYQPSKFYQAGLKYIGTILPSDEGYISFFHGYDDSDDDSDKIIKRRTIIRGNDWKRVREATSEEIEIYNFKNNIIKYNL
jgi:hypothetical protein